MKTIYRGVALAGAIPVIAFSLLTIGAELPHFFSPCFSWNGTGVNPSLMRTVCRGGSGGTSETMAGAIVRLILVQGVCLLAAFLALKGAYRSRRPLLLAASVLMFLMTIPLMIGRFGLIPLIGGICFGLSFLISRSPSRHDTD